MKAYWLVKQTMRLVQGFVELIDGVNLWWTQTEDVKCWASKIPTLILCCKDSKFTSCQGFLTTHYKAKIYEIVWLFKNSDMLMNVITWINLYSIDDIFSRSVVKTPCSHYKGPWFHSHGATKIQYAGHKKFKKHPYSFV